MGWRRLTLDDVREQTRERVRRYRARRHDAARGDGGRAMPEDGRGVSSKVGPRPPRISGNLPKKSQRPPALTVHRPSVHVHGIAGGAQADRGSTLDGAPWAETRALLARLAWVSIRWLLSANSKTVASSMPSGGGSGIRNRSTSKPGKRACPSIRSDGMSWVVKYPRCARSYTARVMVRWCDCDAAAR